MGRLLGGEHASRVGWRLLACQNGAFPDCIVGCCCCGFVVVGWLYYSKRIIIVRGADLSEFFSLIFVGKMCVFVSRPMKIVTFLKKKRDPPKTGC